MLEKNLVNKFVVVTGGSRGIGKHIAKAFQEKGARVLITGRDQTTLDRCSGEIGEGCHYAVSDQRDPESIAQMASSVLKDYGTPDFLVNNAGVFRARGEVKDLSLDLWNEIIGTNLTGVFLTTQAFLPAMLEKNRGDIFMISSMSGKKGDAGTAAYNASKFGLQGFSQALMYEVRRSNIRVMVLNPSSVDTGADSGPSHGPGLHLHARDLADTIVHLACLPGRTLVRDMDIYGTNPF